MTEVINNSKLFSRIAQVMGKVRSLPKDGHNKQSNYKYVSSDNALDAIGKAMSECGVVIIPSMSAYDTATDGKMTRCKAEFDMHVCGADGDTFTCRWISEGIDYGNPDKALTKAITYATKTFLLKLFVVGAGGEDPDSESAPSEQNKTQPAGQQPQQAQRQPVKPATPPATNGATHRQPSQEAKELAASVNATITKVETFNDIPNATTSDETLAAEATNIAAGLSSPPAAQAWAIQNKFCSNEHHARNRWMQIVDKKFNNKVDQRNVKAVILAYVADCLSKPKVQIEQPEAA